MVVDIHFCNTFSTNPIQPSLTFLWAQFMYYIIFYFFKHDPNLCSILEEIEEVWFGGYGLVSFGPFAWASPCVLPSGQGTLVAPQAHGEGLVSKISTSKQLLCSSWLWPKVSVRTLFTFKNGWLSLANFSC